MTTSFTVEHDDRKILAVLVHNPTYNVYDVLAQILLEWRCVGAIRNDNIADAAVLIKHAHDAEFDNRNRKLHAGYGPLPGNQTEALNKAYRLFAEAHTGSFIYKIEFNDSGPGYWDVEFTYADKWTHEEEWLH